MVDKVKLAVANYAMEYDIKVGDVNIACFGLTFKADSDDLRGSPAVKIIRELATWHKGNIFIVEPNIQSLPDKFTKNISLVCFDYALKQANIIVLLVDHKVFKGINLRSISSQWIVDTNGIWINS